MTEDAQIRAIEAAALLHDMGKLAVPEYILNKPGPLTPAEFEKMKLHASVGADILSAIDFPYPVVPIVRHHHENWDGSGYPEGLSGANIPIGARILSVVDCFDALTSDRPYRPRLSDEDAIRIVKDRRGNMYDPLVVDTFLGRSCPRRAADWSELQRHARRIGASDVSLGDHRTWSPSRPTGSNHLEWRRDARAVRASPRAEWHDEPLSILRTLILKHLRRMVPSSLSALYVRMWMLTNCYCAHGLGEHGGLIREMRIATRPETLRLGGRKSTNDPKL